MRSKRKRRYGQPLKLILVLLVAGMTCLVGSVLSVNAFPRLLITVLGLEHLGPVDDALPPEPALLNPSGERLDHVALVLPLQVGEPLTLTLADLDAGGLGMDAMVGDTTIPGRTTYLLTADEASLNDLAREEIFPRAFEGRRYRDGAIDLRSGGLIIYADVDLGIRWQRMGVLLVQDEGALTLSPAGVVLEGTLYAMPDRGTLAHLLLPVGPGAERALHRLTIVGPLPGEARVEIARFSDDHVQIQAQATYAVPIPPDTGWLPLEQGADLREIDVAASGGRVTERLSMVRLDPEAFRVRVHYDPVNPKTISGWGAALDALVVVNGSYFAPESEEGQETIGLLISAGQRWGAPLHDYAGMLAVTSTGEVSVRWLRNQPYDPQEPLTEAMQSFPVLIKPGGVMGFPADGDDGAPARRTVVAQDREGRLLLIVAPRGALSLHELAVFLAQPDLAIDVALNLDGGGSTGMWLTASEAQVAIDSFTPVPSVIAVERR